MKQVFIKRLLPVALSFAPFVLPAQKALGQQPTPNKWSDQDVQRIAQQVQKQLLSLSNYSVFDSLHFGLRGSVVTLGGYASRPQLKQEAENVVKKIQGVTEVDNKIEVLPLSPNDDQIRQAVYQRIYSQPSLSRYTSNFANPAAATAGALRPGGITLDPPLGFHAIHIIVKQGNVTLTGFVDNEGDATIAQMQANSTPGVFSVDNDLRFPGGAANEKGDKK